MVIEVIHADNLVVLPKLQDGYFRLCYIDPPFNTGRKKSRKELSYTDSFVNYYDFLMPRIQQVYRILSPNGSLFIHLDYREVHYVKVWTDEIFGRDNFMNEIIWSYDFGGRSKKKWSSKHDNILWYVKDRNNYIFNYNQVDRIPYLSKGLVSDEKKKLGKPQTDSWQSTIVHTMSKEKTGYPTQKPLKVLERIVRVHSNTGDFLLDCFAGSGSFGDAADLNERHCLLIDENPQAISTMTDRFCSRGVLRSCE